MSADIKEIRSKGGSARIILGISEGGATRQGLELALELFDEVSVFHDPAGRTFHPKVFLAKSSDANRLLVGSNNLTAGGLFRNYEAAIELESNENNLNIFSQVEDWIERLLDEKQCCVSLTASNIVSIVENPIYRIGDEDDSSARMKNRVQKGNLPEINQEPIFARSSSRKRNARHTVDFAFQAKGTTVSLPQGTEQDVPPRFSGRQLLSWSKRLARSDAQQYGGNGKTNLTGALRLTSAGYNIDRTKFFRDELFGGEPWDTDPKRHHVEYTEVTMDVIIDQQSLGPLEFRIDHDLTRESGQKNFTTTLKWGGLNGLLRSTNYIDYWVLLERLTDGYRLTIQTEDPQNVTR